MGAVRSSKLAGSQEGQREAFVGVHICWKGVFLRKTFFFFSSICVCGESKESENTDCGASMWSPCQEDAFACPEVALKGTGPQRAGSGPETWHVSGLTLLPGVCLGLSRHLRNPCLQSGPQETLPQGAGGGSHQDPETMEEGAAAERERRKCGLWHQRKYCLSFRGMAMGQASTAAIPPCTLCSESCQTAQPWLLWVLSLCHTWDFRRKLVRCCFRVLHSHCIGLWVLF